ncbi:hypothetical protein J6E39_07505 [bacterium]|nr:hypothetical protein [bacterium]
MKKELTMQDTEDFLNDLVDSISAITAVTELAECEAVNMHSEDVYIELRIRAFEGMFNLLTAHLINLNSQIKELLNRKYEV